MYCITMNMLFAIRTIQERTGRDFIGQLSAFCLIKASVHIGIYATSSSPEKRSN